MANNTPGSERPWLERARRVKRKTISPRQVKYADFRASGMEPVQAAKAAGYKSPHATVVWLESSEPMSQYNRDQMAKSGITPKRLFDKISDKLDAKRTLFVQIVDERPFEHPVGTKEREAEEHKRSREPKKQLVEEDDNHAQHKFVETAISMGALKPEVQHKLTIEGQVDVNHTVTVIPSVNDDLMNAFASLSPEEKMRALTDRHRKMLTGTLVEEPVSLAPADAIEAEIVKEED